MKLLINDLMRFSDATEEILTAALSDYSEDSSFQIHFDDSVLTDLIEDTLTFDGEDATLDSEIWCIDYYVLLIECIGLGYTNATLFTISNGIDSQNIALPIRTERELKFNNGLYIINSMEVIDLTITHNGDFTGRIGTGKCWTLGTNPTKEIGFYTTNESRSTLSGQEIPGAGGYSGRRASMDVRYKIDSDIYDELEKAYDDLISKSFPYFILFDDEQHKMPVSMLHFYAKTDGPLSMLQSSIYRYLYSYKFDFYERF